MVQILRRRCSVLGAMFEEMPFSIIAHLSLTHFEGKFWEKFELLTGIKHYDAFTLRPRLLVIVEGRNGAKKKLATESGKSKRMKPHGEIQKWPTCPYICLTFQNAQCPDPSFPGAFEHTALLQTGTDTPDEDLMPHNDELM